MKKTSKLTPGKARKILKEGKAHGKPLTEKQRKFFAVKAAQGRRGKRK